MLPCKSVVCITFIAIPRPMRLVYPLGAPACMPMTFDPRTALLRVLVDGRAVRVLICRPTIKDTPEMRAKFLEQLLLSAFELDWR